VLPTSISPCSHSPSLGGAKAMKTAPAEPTFNGALLRRHQRPGCPRRCLRTTFHSSASRRKPEEQFEHLLAFVENRSSTMSACSLFFRRGNAAR